MAWVVQPLFASVACVRLLTSSGQDCGELLDQVSALLRHQI